MQIDYRQFQPFFTKFLTRHSRNPNRPLLRRHVRHEQPENPQAHCLCVVRHYPRMTGEYRWQLSSGYMGSLIGGKSGSKFAAYRIARMRIQSARAYLGQVFVMFIGPKGFLP
jgi:hypothetical protein